MQNMASSSHESTSISTIADYITGKEATRILGVHVRTLYNWDAKGKIETIRLPSNKRMYNVKKFLAKLKQDDYPAEVSEASSSNTDDNTSRLNIAYIRVSSRSQKNDLARQRAFMIHKYPNHQLIEDIGSGMNLNRRGLRNIIHYAIAGRVNELVVAYKDRLARFGFELIEDLITTYSHGRIVIAHVNKELDPEDELVLDTLQIMNIFVAKMNGLRRYQHTDE
jgi:putative resolvase